jgi:hypothetical protein
LCHHTECRRGKKENGGRKEKGRSKEKRRRKEKDDGGVSRCFVWLQQVS